MEAGSFMLNMAI